MTNLSCAQGAKKRPLWVQLLIFLAIEAAFFAVSMALPNLLNLNLLYSLFGRGSDVIWIHVLMDAASLTLCLLQITLHWLLTFEGRGQYRWTVLPIWLWFAATQLIVNGLAPILASAGQPVLGRNLFVYPVAHMVLFLLGFAALGVMVHSLRHPAYGRARALLIAQLILILLTSWVGAGSMIVQNELMMDSLPQVTEPIIITSGDLPDDLPEGMAELFSSLSEDPNTVINFVTGMETDGESIAAFNPDNWANDSSMQAYEEAMAPVNTLSNVLYCVQALGMFFIMKKWLFPAPEPVCEEA